MNSDRGFAPTARATARAPALSNRAEAEASSPYDITAPYGILSSSFHTSR